MSRFFLLTFVRKVCFPILVSLLLSSLIGCMASSEEIHKALDLAAKEDLSIIVKDLPPASRAVLLAKPYYVVDEYQEFKGDTALVYQARAKLVFFYLDSSLDLCQIRKYRFKRSNRSWERYENELKHIPEKFLEPEARP